MTANEHFIKEAKKELAFTCNGVEYYQFTDGGLPIYFNRFRQFQNTFDNHTQFKVTESVLTEAIDMIIHFTNDSSMSPERRIAEVQRVVETFKWRREQSNNLDLLYEIASIWFFDQTEDPAEYDYNYGKKKANIWAENNTCTLPSGEKINLLFFLTHTPLNQFIDFQDLSQVGTLEYLKKLKEVEFSHSLYNLSRLSKSEKSGIIGQNIASLMETSEALWKLIDSELRNTTT